jgi:hypothetical protein
MYRSFPEKAPCGTVQIVNMSNEGITVFMKERDKNGIHCELHDIIISQNAPIILLIYV